MEDSFVFTFSVATIVDIIIAVISKQLNKYKTILRFIHRREERKKIVSVLALTIFFLYDILLPRL